MTTFYAHTTRDSSPWEPLHEHLSLVANRARRHADAFGAGDEAFLAGLLHDLGKYGDLFQKRLRGIGRGIDHWTIGGFATLKKFGWQGLPVALAIEGHHIGLQVGSCATDTISRFEPTKFADRHRGSGRRLSETDLDHLLTNLRDDGLELPALSRSLVRPDMPLVRSMLAVRMLFSALVDADYLETEAFMRSDSSGVRRYRRAGLALEPRRALKILEAHLEQLRRSSNASGSVKAMRAELHGDCVRKAELPQGVFTLTAPTGSGKTLSMLAFALAHAARHDLRRVVFAIPFLSIIEQTAKVYRDLFFGAGWSEEFVLEHHSLAEYDGVPSVQSEDDLSQGASGGGTSDARLLAENWDAPIIVSTNVQLLHSLFSQKPRQCRKLHNLARSVILFDEVQTLPPKLVRATLGALGTLVRDFGCSVVFATATQPAFDHLSKDVQEYCVRKPTTEFECIGWNPEEITRNPVAMFQAAKRTEIIWELETPTSWRDLAGRINSAGGQVLVIVNLKRHARELVELLDADEVAGLYHLSTNLCPAHRTRVLAEVRERLNDDRPCILVSTQCIEAGVDVDFSTVFRALGPLESVAQAAGRCNRSGRRAVGRVVVFRPEDECYPPGVYKQAATITAALVRSNRDLNIDDPATFRSYYRDFYDLTGSATASGGALEEAIRDSDFSQTAKQYRLIDQSTIQVVTPWDLELIDVLRLGPFDATWIRRARATAVSIYRPKFGDFPLLESAPLTPRGETPDDWFLLAKPEAYDRRLYGLDIETRSLWIV